MAATPDFSPLPAPYRPALWQLACGLGKLFATSFRRLHHGLSEFSVSLNGELHYFEIIAAKDAEIARLAQQIEIMTNNRRLAKQQMRIDQLERILKDLVQAHQTKDGFGVRRGLAEAERVVGTPQKSHP